MKSQSNQMLFVSAAIVLLAIGCLSITSEAVGDQTILQEYLNEIGTAADICKQPSATYSQIRALFATILRWWKPGNEAYNVLKKARDDFDAEHEAAMDKDATLNKFLFFICSAHKDNVEIYMKAQDVNKEKKGRVSGGFTGQSSAGRS